MGQGSAAGPAHRRREWDGARDRRYLASRGYLASIDGIGKQMSVDLGMPAVPSAPLAERRKSRQLMVGSVPVGGGAPVSVQSMTTTLTANVNATLQQIAELTAAGCQ